jgi:fatty-acyl-CoA synthase
VAIVQLEGTATPSPAELRDWCCGHLARYKAPRAFVVVDEVRRHASGKADYRWAGEQAADAVDAV